MSFSNGSKSSKNAELFRKVARLSANIAANTNINYKHAISNTEDDYPKPTRCRCGCGCELKSWSATSGYCSDCQNGMCPSTCPKCGKETLRDLEPPKCSTCGYRLEEEQEAYDDEHDDRRKCPTCNYRSLQPNGTCDNCDQQLESSGSDEDWYDYKSNCPKCGNFSLIHGGRYDGKCYRCSIG